MIDIAVAHDGPANSRELAGDSDHDDIPVEAAVGHFVDPCPHSVLATIHVEVTTSGAADDKFPQGRMYSRSSPLVGALRQ